LGRRLYDLNEINVLHTLSKTNINEEKSLYIKDCAW